LSVRLVYHRIGADKGASPFDEALLEVAQEASPLRLASPYIGLGFLQRVLAFSTDWRLLSDVEAWLHSGNRRHRARCWEFIADNLERVRHVEGLHAKVAIGNGKLFLGSANFTEKGILGRAELSVLVGEPEQVNEAIAWFDELWESASPPILEEGDALVSELDSAEWTMPKVRVRLTSTAPKISAVLAETERPAGFDLAGAMAKAGISESVALASVEEAYRRISDEWAGIGRSFTFRELLDAVRGISTGTARAVWTLVTAETANHWLGGLEPDGYDRYVYEGGKFRPFRSPEDNATSGRLGDMLAFLLSNVPMLPEQKPMPFESAWAAVGVAETRIIPVIELLLDVGFLVEHDVAGELETWSVSPEFDWPPRWDKFRRAKNLFDRLRSEAADMGEDGAQTDELDDADDEGYSRKTGGGGSSPHGGISQLKELELLAGKLRVSVGKLLNSHDSLLTALIEVLAEAPSPIVSITRSEILAELRAVNMVDSVYQEFKNKGDGILLSAQGGMVLNRNWDSERFFRHYSDALAKWRKAVLGESATVQVKP
jgi:hypothetical protein